MTTLIMILMVIAMTIPDDNPDDDPDDNPDDNDDDNDADFKKARPLLSLPGRVTSSITGPILCTLHHSSLQSG